MARASVLGRAGWALATAAVACASGTKAETQLGLFKALCVETRAYGPSAIAAADAMGWKPAPKSLLDGLAKPEEPGEIIVGVDGRFMTDATGFTVVVVARTNKIIPKHTMDADVCAVAVGPKSDIANLKADAAAFARVPQTPAVVDVKGADGYLWREAAGQHNLMSASELVGAANDPAVTVLVAISEGGIGMLGLAVPASERN